MTVQSQTDSIGYDGPGSAFSIPFRFLSNGDIRITKAPADGSTPVTLTLTTDYTLTGARQQGGGTATLVVPLVAGDAIVIDRGNMQRTQLIDYRANDPFPEEDAEDGLDRLTMLLQQGLLDGSVRSLRLPVTGVDGASSYQGNGNRISNISAAINPTDVPNLSQVTGLIGPGSGPFLQAGSGAKTRSYQDRDRDTIHIMDYLTESEISDVRLRGFSIDVTSQVQAVLTNFPDRRIIFPAGRYKLSAQLTFTGNVELTGDGIGNTTLEWTAAAASTGISIILQNRDALWQDCVRVADLELLTGKAASGTALYIRGSTQGNPGMPNVVVQNVAARGVVGAFTDGWLQGLWMDHCANAFVDRFFFSGKISGLGEPTYDSQYGIRYDNDSAQVPHQTNAQIQNCVCLYTQTSAYVRDTEGVQFRGNNFVGTNIGIHISGPAAYPYFSVLDNHINCSTRGVFVQDVKQVLIQNNAIYKQLGNFTGYGVSMIGVAAGLIRGNMFENLNSNALGISNMVTLETCSRCFVDGNTFYLDGGIPAGSVPIWVVDAGATDNVVGNNIIYPGYDAILDNGVRTVIPQGTYTPTLVNVANVTSSVASSCQWMRVGNVITVSGSITVDPTLAGTLTQLEIPLPVASNFSGRTHCAGTGSADTTEGQVAVIYGSIANDRAVFQYVPPTVISSVAWFFSFTYRVL